MQAAFATTGQARARPRSSSHCKCAVEGVVGAAASVKISGLE